SRWRCRRSSAGDTVPVAVTAAPREAVAEERCPAHRPRRSAVGLRGFPPDDRLIGRTSRVVFDDSAVGRQALLGGGVAGHLLTAGVEGQGAGADGGPEAVLLLVLGVGGGPRLGSEVGVVVGCATQLEGDDVVLLVVGRVLVGVGQGSELADLQRRGVGLRW